MPKPIFIIGLPEAAGMDQEAIQNQIARKLEDYYVIIYPINDEKPEFKVFFEKDFNLVKYEELKQIVLDAVKT